MEEESERGRPTFIALGHRQYVLWAVERLVDNFPLSRRSADQLLSIKVDHWPNEPETPPVES